MEPTDNTGFRTNPDIHAEDHNRRVKIPVVPIYRFKNAFYKHLQVDDATMDLIKFYNLVKQEAQSTS